MNAQTSAHDDAHRLLSQLRRGGTQVLIYHIWLLSGTHQRSSLFTQILLHTLLLIKNTHREQHPHIHCANMETVESAIVMAQESLAVRYKPELEELRRDIRTFLENLDNSSSTTGEPVPLGVRAQQLETVESLRKKDSVAEAMLSAHATAETDLEQLKTVVTRVQARTGVAEVELEAVQNETAELEEVAGEVPGDIPRDLRSQLAEALAVRDRSQSAMTIVMRYVQAKLYALQEATANLEKAAVALREAWSTAKDRLP